MAVSLTLDGVPVLTGACAEINGTIYVPVERFVNLFGSFDVTYTASPEQVTVAGDNLSIQVHVGDAYITVNGRVLYTGAKVLSLRGWIFAPLPALATAVNAQLTVKQGWYQASLTSGNPAAVASASQVYNSTDLYWLSRIISAEAKGESLEGQIAVGNVVLNRVRSSEFPSTVKEVIFDTKYGVQFSPVSNGTIYDTPTESAVLAAKICLEGYSLSDSALYFFNPALATSSWIKRSRTYIMTIGNHAFYA
jgi:N-acetylmuramoyl-L-alanine amidase